jgi:tetratricopeptide (TPR) repeat protein
MLTHGDPWLWALVPTGFGLQAMLSGDLDRAEEGLREGAAQFRELGERWGLSMSLDHLSQVLGWRGQFVESLSLMDEALALMREIGATDDCADLLCRRAESRALQGDPEGARADYELAACLARNSGMPETRASAYLGMSTLARRGGDLAAARALSERALAECSSGSSFAVEAVRAAAMTSLGWVAVAEHAPAQATSLFQDALLTAGRRHAWSSGAGALEGLAAVASLEGHPERAALLLGAAVAVRGVAISGDPDVTSIAGPLRDSLGAEAFDRAYDVGRGMTAQKALTTAGVTP